MQLHFKRSTNSSNSSELVSGGNFIFECSGYEAGKYIWAFFSMLCFVVGVPASVSILREMLRSLRRSPLTPNDFFILNLSIMDMVFLFFIPPGVLNHFLFLSSTFESVWNCVYALSTCGRPLMMACVCLDCYVAVVHPVIYHHRKSLAPRVVMAAVVWALTLTNGIAYSVHSMLYYTEVPAIAFLVAIAIIVICDSFIIWTLVKSDSGRRNIHPQKQRAIQTVTCSLVIAVISYFPPVLILTVSRPLIKIFKIFMCTVVYPVTLTSTMGSVAMPLLSLYNLGKLDCSKVACFKL